MDTEKDFLKRDLSQAETQDEVKQVMEDAELMGHEDIAALAKEKLEAIVAKAQSAETPTPGQVAQVEAMGGSQDEIVKRTEGVNTEIDAVKIDAERRIAEVSETASPVVERSAVLPLQDKNTESSDESNAENPLEKEINEKIQSALAECMELANSSSIQHVRDDVKGLFRDYLTGNPLVDFTIKLKALTPDNRKIIEERIDRVSEYAKAHVVIADTFDALQQAINRFGKYSKEVQIAQKPYDEAYQKYRVAQALLKASNIEVIKSNDPKLEDEANLSQVAFDLNAASEFQTSLNSIPYTKAERRDILTRYEAREKSA